MLVLQCILIGLITLLVTCYVKFRWNRRHLYRLAAKIPGCKGLPLFGVALTMLGKNEQDTFKQLISLASEFPSPSTFWIGYICFVAIDKPEDLQVVLNSQDAIDKALIYKMIMQNGLVVDGGDLWRSHRKLLNPAFYPTILQTFLPAFNDKSKILVKVLAKHLDTDEFDVFHPISGCTLETLLSTSIGLEKDIQNDPNNWYLHCVKMGLEIVFERLFRIWLHFKPLYMFTNLYKLEKKYVQNGMLAIGDEILKEKELQYKNKSIRKDHPDENDVDENGIKKPQIFIDQLLKMREHFTLSEIKDELNIIILAGHETTAVTMSTTLVMLALHQNVQEKVIQELEDVFDSIDQEIDNDLLKNLHYLDMVIKETLRLFPVIPLFGREATKDIELKSCTIPAGANIIINVFNVHKNPIYWGDDAHVFNPDRFLPENFSKIHPYAYIPFSKGPRNCIGMIYGMNVMKVVLTHILRNYKVKTSLKFEDLDFKMTLTLQIVQGYMIKLEKRVFK